MEALHKWLPQVWAFMNESKVIGGVIIVVAFAILAWVVDFIMNRVLTALVRKSKFRLDDKILEILHRPVWVSVILVGAIAAVQWISPRPPFPFILTAVLKSLLVLIWAFTINRMVLSIVEDWIRHWREAGREGSEIIGLVGNITRVVVLAGGIFLLLSIWKINITPLLASAGIAGVAVALAAKETLSNFFGGVTVLLDQPYKVGDYIVLDSGERGEVVEIGLRSTRILTRDDVQISIPNAIITNTKVINESAPEPRFRAGYGSKWGWRTGAMLIRWKKFSSTWLATIRTCRPNQSLECGFVFLGIHPWILNYCAGPIGPMTREG